MAGRGEHRHVHPEFGEVDPRDAPEPLGLRLIGGQERGDQGIQRGNGAVQVLHMRKLVPEESALHRAEAPREGGYELWRLLPEPPLGEAGQDPRVRLAVHQYRLAAPVKSRPSRPSCPREYSHAGLHFHPSW